MINPLVILGAIVKGKSSVWGFLKWIAVLGFIGICFWGLYAGLIRPTTKPNPSESQTADNITNHNYNLNPKQTFFGCANFKIEDASKKIEGLEKRIVDLEKSAKK
jgi:hypothetical protein